MQSSSSYTGQIVNGYRVGPLLGVGGMGEVYQGFRVDDDSPVAIKFLRREYADDITFQQRFVREIRITQALKHDHIIPIFDHGLFNGNQLFYTMRLVTGMTLATRMKRRKLSPLGYLEILEQVTDALGYGHTLNVVHRDLKTDNIFMEKQADGHLQVFVGDFGLSKREGTDVNLTEAGAAIGTPYYMSPESIMGEKSTPLSDIYSLTILSYEVLVGRLPFNDPQAHAVAIAHVTRPIPDPKSISPDFPAPLEKWLNKGTAKNPEERFQTMQEMLSGYEDALVEMSEEECAQTYAVDA
jgi:serine/threonine protein kinase